jgi:allantoicase
MAFKFLELIDLASEQVGGKTLLTSDDFFAPKENLLKVEPPIFIPGKYTEFGKWMDGWESRRKRLLAPGNDHDWCTIRLGLPGIVRGVNIDTAHFTGNYPESAAIDACEILGEPDEKTKWNEILAPSLLKGGSDNLFEIQSQRRWTHLRLRMIPDGGIARLRVYGEVLPNIEQLKASKDLVDLVAAENGGRAILCNDMYFGKKDNLIFPGRSKNMGDGWETRRKRGEPTADWIILKAAVPGTVSKIEVDTNHFKGNFPESFSLEGCSPDSEIKADEHSKFKTQKWTEILPRTKLSAHKQHYFENEISNTSRNLSFKYFRLNIFPDGGVSRLRILGRPKV